MITILALAVALLPQVVENTEREVVVAGKRGQRLDQYLETCALFGFSGCALVEHEGQLLLRKGYGDARPGDGVPNTPETLFDIASASKQVTAAAILKLEAEGRLDISDSIAEYLPDVPKQHREVTLYHLLTHTSGFPRGGPAGSGSDREAAVARYLSAERSGKAGKRFEYYNGGYALLAATLEHVTGEEFEDWVRQNLFDPAGLAQTDFIETARVDQDRIAATHDGYPKLATDYIKGWGYRGMGGVLTSVSDLALWCHALFGGEVLPSPALEKMLTPNRDQYACGWYVFETEKKRRVIQHGGTAPGFGSYIRYFPDDRALILVTCNRAGWDWQMTWGLTALLLEGELMKAAAPPEIVAWKQSGLEDLAGRWTGKAGTLFVEAEEKRVVLGSLDAEIVQALSPKAQGRPTSAGSATQAKQEDLDWAEERAVAIVAELREGSCELLGEDLVRGVPQSWPGRVLTDYWPAQEERWGPTLDHRSLGAFFDPDQGRTRVWIQLQRESGARAVEVAFVGKSLNIFDLKAKPYPAVAYLAPIAADHLVGFDFQSEPPFELKLTRAGKQLELRSRGGKKLSFRRGQ